MIFQCVAAQLLFHHVLPMPGTSALADALFFLGGRQIGAHAFEHFRRHADQFAQCRMRMDGLADVDRIASHLDGEANLADQVARMGADDAAAEHAVVGFIEQELGEALVAPIGDGAAGCRPGKHRLAVLDALAPCIAPR